MHVYRIFFTHCTYNCDINAILCKLWSGQVCTFSTAEEATHAAKQWQRLAYLATRKVDLPESLRGQNIAGIVTVVNLASGDIVMSLAVTRA